MTPRTSTSRGRSRAGGRARLTTSASASRFGHRVEPLEPRRLLAAGDLDPTFGQGGTVVTDVIGRAEALAAEVSLATPDGKLLVAGQTRNAGGNDFALARYHPDGSLDRTFGDSGRVVTDINPFDEIADADVLPDGKIVVVGTTAPSFYHFIGGGADFAVARYTADGSLDATFGDGGIVVTSIDAADDPDDAGSPTIDVAAAVAVSPGGKLVVVGSASRYPGGGDIAVVRYNADGSLDRTFGGDGKVVTNAYPESEDGEISASDDAAADV
jgi:uncharacterized delta-60 repeat protein